MSSNDDSKREEDKKKPIKEVMENAKIDFQMLLEDETEEKFDKLKAEELKYADLSTDTTSSESKDSDLCASLPPKQQSPSGVAKDILQKLKRKIATRTSGSTANPNTESATASTSEIPSKMAKFDQEANIRERKEGRSSGTSHRKERTKHPAPEERLEEVKCKIDFEDSSEDEYSGVVKISQIQQQNDNMYEYLAIPGTSRDEVNPLAAMVKHLKETNSSVFKMASEMAVTYKIREDEVVALAAHAMVASNMDKEDRISEWIVDNIYTDLPLCLSYEVDRGTKYSSILRKAFSPEQSPAIPDNEVGYSSVSSCDSFDSFVNTIDSSFDDY
ncbi:hypothetical protein CHUAL_012566 [Chamberlinius hualienensis]